MRGAGLRLNVDVRRLWRCAVCGAERRIGAQVTAVRCQCPDRPGMKLVEGKRLERPLKELSSPYLEFDFEPGELAPPRTKHEETPAPVTSELPDDSEVPVGEGGDASPATETAEQRPQQSQRPPRRDDRRSDRRGDRTPDQSRNAPPPRDSGSHRDQPPRRDNRNSGGPRPEGPRSEGQRSNAPHPEGQRPPRTEGPHPDRPRSDAPPPEPASGESSPPSGDETPSTPSRRNRRPRRRDDRPASPPADTGNSGFGEGIPAPPT